MAWRKSPGKTQRTHHVGLSFRAIQGNLYEQLRLLTMWWAFCVHKKFPPLVAYQLIVETMKKQLVCSECGSVGKTKRDVKGNLAIEIVLWLCFLLPGLIYSIWRQTTYHESCAVCGSAKLIPADSPMGQKLIREHGGSVELTQAENTTVGGWSLKWKILTGFVVLLVVSFVFVQIASSGQ